MSISSERVKKWRIYTKNRMVEAMGGECQCCGYNKTNRALSFHHIDPKEKEIGFGNIRADPKSWTKIVEELRKCILVCHNCHSEIHDKIRMLPEKYVTFKEEFSNYRKIEKFDSCLFCGNDKPVKQKFCSHKCAQTNRRKVDWDNINLLDLFSKYSIGELERMLGVSNAVIYKRRKKIIKMS